MGTPRQWKTNKHLSTKSLLTNNPDFSPPRNVIRNTKQLGGKHSTIVYQQISDLDDPKRLECEVFHTLVKNGTIPIRHQQMTRVKARKLNSVNKEMNIPLEWVLGKQKLLESFSSFIKKNH